MTQHPSDPFATPPPAITTPVVAPVAVRRRSAAGLFVNLLLGVALVVAVGGVAFAAGRATAPVAATTGRGGFTGNGGTFGANGFGPNASGAPGRGGAFGAGGLTVQGTVTAVTADSITLQLTSGQSITIPTDSQTTYHTRSAASASDVTTGSTVLVQLNGGRVGGGADSSPAPSGAPNRGTGSASSVTVVPAGS